jgi:hypothetical protein
MRRLLAALIVLLLAGAAGADTVGNPTDRERKFCDNKLGRARQPCGVDLAAASITRRPLHAAPAPRSSA